MFHPLKVLNDGCTGFFLCKSKTLYFAANFIGSTFDSGPISKLYYPHFYLYIGLLTQEHFLTIPRISSSSRVDDFFCFWLNFLTRNSLLKCSFIWQKFTYTHFAQNMHRTANPKHALNFVQCHRQEREKKHELFVYSKRKHTYKHILHASIPRYKVFIILNI